MMPLPFCTYVLFSRKDFLLYIGYTSNIERRLVQHNAGETTSTRYRRPLELIFCEFYIFKTDAIKREDYFKTNAGKRTLKLMLRSTFDKLGYKGKSLGNLQVEFEIDSEEEV
jgi:putative endonuclease